MGYRSKEPKSLRKRYLLFMLAIVAVATAFYMDIFVLKISFIAEGLPQFGVSYVFRSFLIMLSALFFVGAILSRDFPKRKKPGITRPRLADNMSSWGVLTLSVKSFTERDLFRITVKEVILWSVLLFSAMFVLIFIMEPRLFRWLGSEDRPIEMLSALCSFVASGIFVYNFLSFKRSTVKRRRLLSFICIGFACCFFLIAMEEISWFQRIASIETPKALGGNLQAEMNLHNFATDYIENIYYFGAFVFLVLMAFIRENSSFFERHDSIGFFIPSRFVLFSSAIFLAYNYDMWNLLHIQLGFFVTLFILAYYTYSWGFLQRISYLHILLCTYVVTQLLFIILGKRFMRIWGVTEYKELFIPLSFLIYSFEVLQKTIVQRKFSPGETPVNRSVSGLLLKPQ